MVLTITSSSFSSKFLTTFSDFRLPEDKPDFVTPERYVQYLEDYTKHFNIIGRIRFKTLVSSVRPLEHSGHTITTIDRDSGTTTKHHCDAIIVCSGLNLNSSIPTNIKYLFPKSASRTSSSWIIHLTP